MDAQYAAAYPELYRRHWWSRVREEILLRNIRNILAAVPEARILDVGCGAALFFDALESFGHVEGVESDRAAVEGSGRWRSRIVVGNLDGAYKPAAPFDLILMLDVLEHIQDTDQLLRDASKILTPASRTTPTSPSPRFLSAWASRHSARSKANNWRPHWLAPPNRAKASCWRWAAAFYCNELWNHRQQRRPARPPEKRL